MRPTCQHWARLLSIQAILMFILMFTRIELSRAGCTMLFPLALSQPSISKPKQEAGWAGWGTWQMKLSQGPTWRFPSSFVFLRHRAEGQAASGKPCHSSSRASQTPPAHPCQATPREEAKRKFKLSKLQPRVLSYSANHFTQILS